MISSIIWPQLFYTYVCIYVSTLCTGIGLSKCEPRSQNSLSFAALLFFPGLSLLPSSFLGSISDSPFCQPDLDCNSTRLLNSLPSGLPEFSDPLFGTILPPATRLSLSHHSFYLSVDNRCWSFQNPDSLPDLWNLHNLTPPYLFNFLSHKVQYISTEPVKLFSYL